MYVNASILYENEMCWKLKCYTLHYNVSLMCKMDHGRDQFQMCYECQMLRTITNV